MSHVPSRAPGYLDLLKAPGALVFFIATLIGRIPLPMRPLGSILLIEQVTGSYGLAGAVGATTTFVAAVAPPAGLLAVIAFVGIASLTLALQPRSAEHQVRTGGARLTGGAGSGGSIIANRGIQVLVSALFCLGLIFGAVELMMVAFAEDQGSPEAASYLVAIFALGSMLSAIVVGSRSWATPPPRRFVIWSVALSLGTVPILLANTIPFMAIAVFVTGIGIAPTMIAANSVVEGLAERNRLNEAFAWLSSAVASGVAIGSIIAGVVIDELGTRGGQAVGVVAGGLAALVVVIGASTLQGRRQTRSRADRVPE